MDVFIRKNYSVSYKYPAKTLCGPPYIPRHSVQAVKTEQSWQSGRISRLHFIANKKVLNSPLFSQKHLSTVSKTFVNDHLRHTCFFTALAAHSTNKKLDVTKPAFFTLGASPTMSVFQRAEADFYFSITSVIILCAQTRHKWYYFENVLKNNVFELDPTRKIYSVLACTEWKPSSLIHFLLLEYLQIAKHASHVDLT